MPPSGSPSTQRLIAGLSPGEKQLLAGSSMMKLVSFCRWYRECNPEETGTCVRGAPDDFPVRVIG